MSLFTDPNRIPENYGLKIAGALIAYFLFMQVVGLSHHVELRLLNVIIIVGGLYYSLKKFKTTHADHMNYFRGLVTGVATGAIASVATPSPLIWLRSPSTPMVNRVLCKPACGSTPIFFRKRANSMNGCWSRCSALPGGCSDEAA